MELKFTNHWLGGSTIATPLHHVKSILCLLLGLPPQIALPELPLSSETRSPPSSDKKMYAELSEPEQVKSSKTPPPPPLAPRDAEEPLCDLKVSPVIRLQPVPSSTHPELSPSSHPTRPLSVHSNTHSELSPSSHRTRPLSMPSSTHTELSPPPSPTYPPRVPSHGHLKLAFPISPMPSTHPEVPLPPVPTRLQSLFSSSCSESTPSLPFRTCSLSTPTSSRRQLPPSSPYNNQPKPPFNRPSLRSRSPSPSSSSHLKPSLVTDLPPAHSSGHTELSLHPPPVFSGSHPSSLSTSPLTPPSSSHQKLHTPSLPTDPPKQHLNSLRLPSLHTPSQPVFQPKLSPPSLPTNPPPAQSSDRPKLPPPPLPKRPPSAPSSSPLVVPPSSIPDHPSQPPSCTQFPSIPVTNYPMTPPSVPLSPPSSEEDYGLVGDDVTCHALSPPLPSNKPLPLQLQAVDMNTVSSVARPRVCHPVSEGKSPKLELCRPRSPKLVELDNSNADNPFKMDIESMDISKLILEQLDTPLDPHEAQLWMLLEIHQMVRKVKNVHESAVNLHAMHQVPPPLPVKPSQNKKIRRFSYENTSPKPPVPKPRRRISKCESGQNTVLMEDNKALMEDNKVPMERSGSDEGECEGQKSQQAPKNVIKLYNKKKVMGKLQYLVHVRA